MGGQKLGGRFHGSRGHGRGPGPGVRRWKRDGLAVRAGTLDGLQHRTGERGTVTVRHRRERESYHKHDPDE